jgi:hypothetical protein
VELITVPYQEKNTPNGQPEVRLYLAYEQDVLRQSARHRPENTKRQDDDVQRGRYKSWKSEGCTGRRSRYAIKLRSVDTVPSRRCQRRNYAWEQPWCAHPLIARRVSARMFSLGPTMVPLLTENEAPSSEGRTGEDPATTPAQISSELAKEAIARGRRPYTVGISTLLSTFLNLANRRT